MGSNKNNTTADDKSGDLRPDPGILGRSSRPLKGNCLSDGRTHYESSTMHEALHGNSICTSRGLAQTTGTDGQRMVDLISWCRLRMRPVQLHLLSFFRPSHHSIHHVVPVTSLLHPHLQWWVQRDNIPSSPTIRGHINGRLSDRMGAALSPGFSRWGKSIAKAFF